MRRAETYRGHRRQVAKAHGEPMVHFGGAIGGQGKRLTWLKRHPKLAPFYRMAVAVLENGPKATPARWHAIKKMMVVLAQSPRVPIPGVTASAPYVVAIGRHERGPWRSFPHVVIDANLKVTPDAQPTV